MIYSWGYNMAENIKLVKPNINLKNEYLYMISEWKEYGGELIPWSLNLDTVDFDSFVENLNGYSDGIGLPGGFLPFTTYWLINNNNKVLGAIEIRHKLNAYLAFRGGHIGYGIRPSERNKGYAVNMLSMSLPYCKTIGLSKILITCLKDNIGSAKTIIKNGGILDSEDIDNGNVFQRYWINL